ncbi:probable glutamate receptor [Periplaneta americana]|uniref:probable glutamate receptor n=1 Tax=Periplaneta americana TaxID=6978 RepID=UPI0037E9297D
MERGFWVTLALLTLTVVSSAAGYQRVTGPLESITACFLAEYARWRKLEQVVLFGRPAPEILRFVRSMNKRGVFVTLQDFADPKLPSALHIQRHRLGAMVMMGDQSSTAADDFLEQVSQKLLFHAYVSWLIVTSVDSNFTFEDRVRFLNIGVDADLVVATLKKTTKEDEAHRSIKNMDTPPRSKRQSSRYRQKDRRGDVNREIRTCVTNSDRAEYSGTAFSLEQIYKIRPTSNSSLVAQPLGSWGAKNGTRNLTFPSDIEQRNDFRGLPLLVGVKNASQNTAETGDRVFKDMGLAPQSSDDEIEDDNHLMDVLDFIVRSLNASYELVPFSKLGWQNEEGAWLFMLGAVTTGTVDLGLDNVVITRDRSKDMFFTLPIVQSMRNIYFRRPESSAMRDIFLAPFSPRLLASVAMTGVVIATAMVLVTASTKKKTTGADTAVYKTRWSLGEAMVWSVSVLCMQGSSWSPNSPSGCLVLIFSLCFALVIYNAYAAFITSVLSVRVASIRGLGDLLDSDFHFGYTLRGQDETFLRSVNDTTLRRLYFRGLVRNHGVREASEGLLKAARGGYAFFVSARLGRKALNSFIAQDKRCSIQELTVEATRSAIALPMGFASPYRRLVNLSLLRMREAGVLGPIQERMLPPMPRCQAYSAFNSASLTDVYSAFLVLVVGLATAIFMGISEKIWKRRVSLGNWIALKWAGKDRRESLPIPPRFPVHKPTRLHPGLHWLD